MSEPLNDAETCYARANQLSKEIAGESLRLMNHCATVRESRRVLLAARGDIATRRARAALEIHACDMIQWRMNLEGKVSQLMKHISDAGMHVDVSEILKHCPEEVAS